VPPVEAQDLSVNPYGMAWGRHLHRTFIVSKQMSLGAVTA
jgi:hypothetical protein